MFPHIINLGCDPMAHSSREYQREYMRKKREREHYEELKAIIANYQGRRKEIYDSRSKTYEPLKKKKTEGFIAEVTKIFDNFYEQNPIKIEDVKPFLLKDGIDWNILTSEAKTKIKYLVEKQGETIIREQIEEYKKEKIPEYILKFEIMFLEKLTDLVELKFQLEHNSETLDNAVHKIVGRNLRDSLLDNITKKMKKELLK